jgi:hypothetical protein
MKRVVTGIIGVALASSVAVATGAGQAGAAQQTSTGQQSGAVRPGKPGKESISDTQKALAAVPRNYTPAKTPWGDPDLQGKWPGVDLVGVPMQRPANLGTRTRLTEEEFLQRQAAFEKQAAQDEAEFDLEAAAATPGGDVGGPVSPPPHWLERGRPQYIASLIVDPPDGRMPPLTAEAQARSEAAAAARKQSRRGPADSYTDRSLYDRCITRGIAGSFLPVIYNNGNEIVQGPGWVALRNEMIHETRVVPLDRRPRLSPAIKSFMGDSRGWWDGDTLVVETTNFNERTSGIAVNGGGGPNNRHTTALTVTERITRVSPDLLVWRMTFDDPKTWTRPWTIELPLKRDDDYGFFEYACHEGNYSMFNILSGARADEAAAEAASRTQQR